MHKAPHQRGFTLIELIVVIAIIAILLSIAIPSYRDYILRARVRTAQADLAALSLNAENFLQRTLSYSPTDTTTTAATKTMFPGWSPAGTDFVFGYDVTVAANTTYKVTASFSGDSDRLAGCALTLESNNTRTMSEGCEKLMGGRTW